MMCCFQDAAAAFEAELCKHAQALNNSAAGQARYGAELSILPYLQDTQDVHH